MTEKDLDSNLERGAHPTAVIAREERWFEGFRDGLIQRMVLMDEHRYADARNAINEDDERLFLGHVWLYMRWCLDMGHPPSEAAIDCLVRYFGDVFSSDSTDKAIEQLVETARDRRDRSYMGTRRAPYSLSCVRDFMKRDGLNKSAAIKATAGKLCVSEKTIEADLTFMAKQRPGDGWRLNGSKYIPKI